VYVYDVSLNPLSQSDIGFIHLLELDAWGSVHDRQTGQALAGGGDVGASLTIPPPPFPIEVVLDDTQGRYASASLGFLNGSLPARLDVTLYPLPVAPVGAGQQTGPQGGPAGGAPNPGSLTLAQLNRLVGTEVNDGRWTRDQAVGVTTLVRVITRAVTFPNPDEDLMERVLRWVSQLRNLGLPLADFEDVAAVPLAIRRAETPA
jgi:hypothetical protein